MTILDVAAFIKFCLGDHIPNGGFRLQKLLYYCQTEFVRRYGRLMFPEPMLGWVHGPCSPLVRKVWGRHQFEPDFPLGDPSTLSVEAMRVVQITIDQYGWMPIEELKQSVHEEQPWLQARKGLGPTDRGGSQIKFI